LNIRPLLSLSAALLLAGCATGPSPRPAARPLAAVAITGVASCDAYLASYLACHRAAAIYPADQLQAHYQSMRDTLLQAAQNPKVRPYLDARCRLLTDQMGQTLQGRSCDAPAAKVVH